MRVVYIDGVFLLNAAADCFVLLATARIAGLPLRRWRYVCAALAGGLYAAAAFVPGWTFLNAPPCRCAAGIGMALVAFGGEARLGRLTGLCFAVSCAYAGCTLALELLGGVNALEAALLSAAAIWLAAGSGTVLRRRTENVLLPVQVRILDRTAELTALWDSGNGLREDGQPVLIVSPERLSDLLPPDLRGILHAGTLRSPADLLEPLMKRRPCLRPRLIAYHAVGVEAGLLLTVEGEWIEIGGARMIRPRLALSPTELGEGYNALWGGETGRRKNRGSSQESISTHAPLSGGERGN